MKLKCRPADFQVEEQTDCLADGGPFALYRLTKRSLTTLEVVDQLITKWQLRRPRVSYGGLKDKHAETRQFVTVHGGPKRNLRQDSWELVYLGQRSRPFTPADIGANRFEIVLRDLSPAEFAYAREALDDVAASGLPNYFDDQRFGSVGESGEFIARPWCQGNYERALWLALADANEDDDADEREQKRLLREHWGQWVKCKSLLSRSHRRSVITYLADKPDRADFRGAFARIKVDLRGLYLSAFQSFVWNRMLAAYVRQTLSEHELFDVALKLGPAPFFRSLTPDNAQQLATVSLPLPSARLHLEDGPVLTLIQSVLAEQGLELREMRVKYPRDSFFSKGQRAVRVMPRELSWDGGDDELYRGRQKLTLRFVLPRGAYATILVKRVTLV